MSQSEEYEEVEISSEGIRVIKRFEDDEFPVPAIAFEFTSAREDAAVTVRLSDTVPDAVAVEDLGFHPEYGSEHWTIEEGRITFERSFEPESSYTTVYGIRAAGSDDIGQFLTEPEIEEVDPPLPTDSDEIVFESDDHIVEEALGDENELGETGKTDSAEDSEDEEEIEPLNLGTESERTTESEPAAGTDSVTSSAAAETESATAAADTESQSLDTESLVAALADELQNESVPESDLTVLRQELVPEEATAEDTPPVDSHSGSVSAQIEQLKEDMAELRSVTARLDRIQRDVADLRAYTGALEEFLDDHGTGEEILEGFEQQLEEVERRLDELEAEVGDVSGAELDGGDETVDLNE